MIGRKGEREQVKERNKKMINATTRYTTYGVGWGGEAGVRLYKRKEKLNSKYQNEAAELLGTQPQVEAARQQPQLRVQIPEDLLF